MLATLSAARNTFLILQLKPQKFQSINYVSKNKGKTSQKLVVC